MKPEDKIKRLIDQSSVKTDSEVDKKILGDASEYLKKLKQKKSADSGSGIFRVISNSPATRLAAAAIVLIAAGFVAGRLSTPQPTDMEQLHADLAASLQPVISQSVLEQVDRDRQLALAKTCNQLKNEINQQLRQDLSEFGVKILTASGATTNQLLKELLISIGTVQLQDRYRMAAALEQIESNRLNDKNQLSKGLVGLAALTRGELLRTKYDMVRMLSMKEPDKSIQDVPKLPIPQDERKKK
ncbi:MAG: hypothetical protein ACYSU3_23475 [Planctomycetota bacterium]|jgi:hypothetical protein